MEWCTCSLLWPLTSLVKILWCTVLMMFGVGPPLICAQVINSTDVSGTQQLLGTTSTQLWVLAFVLSTLLTSDMVEWKLLLKFLRETGSGLQFGCYLLTRLMVNGQLLVRSILWNLEVMIQVVQLVAQISSVQLYTGAQLSTKIGTKWQLKSTNITSRLVTACTPMVYSGQKNDWSLTSMMKVMLCLMWTWNLSLSGSVVVLPVTTLGEMNPIVHPLTKSSILLWM